MSAPAPEPDRPSWPRRLVRWLLRRRPPAPPPPPLVPPAPPVEFRAGQLRITVTCQGTRVALERQTRVVYDVVVEDGPGERRWASRYGFGGAGASERAAAEAALEEMERLHRDPDGWGKDWTGGMSPRAAEAVLEAPRAHEDREAAEWIGPLVVQLRAQGLWLEPADVADEGSGAST